MKKKSSLIILLILLITVAFSFVFFNMQLSSVSNESEPISFVVDENANLTVVTNKLEAENIIKSATFTKLYGKLSKKSNFTKGRFNLDKSWNSKEILNFLTDSSNAIGEVSERVTLTPGSWAKDMAKTFESKLDVSAEDLLSLWTDEAYVKTLINDYEFLTNDILNSDLKVFLEGYLAPNTYDFYVNASADSITRKLLDQTDMIYNKYKAQFDASKYSIHEIFTLASITQYESGNYEDDQIIAGVWENRLAIDMKLQSSVTVCYSLYEFDNWRDCEQNTLIDSPFNTYMYAGIPIGPILNPGEDSIKATLNPKESDYMYFVADVYGDGSVHYAKTYDEHLANVKKYLGY